MKSKRLSVASLWGTALGLAGSALVSHAAMATSALPSCSSYDAAFTGTGYSGPGAAVAGALDAALGGGALILGMQGTEYPGGTLNSAIPEAVCQIGVAVSSNSNPAQSYVNFVVMMPEAGWNGRFLGTGNGGFAGPLVAGGVPSSAVQTVVLGVAEGYAAATNDLGTAQLFNCNTLFCGSTEGVQLYPNQKPGGLFGDAAALQDFGYGATHMMTVAAKALVTNYYGAAPKYNYFHGCSTGGQQALMEAERFPTDYDGILAGSPAYDRTHLHIGSAALFEALHSAADGSSLLTPEALGLAHAGVLASCAGTDGGLPTDNYLTRPAVCSFNASVLQCTGAQGEVPCTDPTGTSCTCLAPAQVTSVNAAYTGALDSKGRVLYPGYERGVEDPNSGVILEQEGVTEPLFDSLDYWGFGANFQWQSLFASTSSPQGELFGKISALDNTAVGTSTMAGVLNANEANISAFEANGGKLIMYAGYEDPLIPSASSIDYYNKLSAHIPNASSFAALFLAPGMWHCSGGPGANVFGNFNLPPVPTAPGDDILGALVTWREANLLSNSITATKYNNDNSADGIAFQRPICEYPQVATYNGKGQPTYLASSFTCKVRAKVNNQGFNQLYGPVFTPTR